MLTVATMSVNLCGDEKQHGLTLDYRLRFLRGRGETTQDIGAPLSRPGGCWERLLGCLLGGLQAQPRRRDNLEVCSVPKH